MINKTFTFNKNNSFCISLESSNKRWLNMSNQFKTFDFEITKWNASTIRDIKDKFKVNLTPYQKACAQSHINLWRHIIKNNIDYALILEDDACFDNNWVNKLNNFFTDIKDDEWDSIYLNASEPLKILNKWILTNDQFLTGGYIISKKGACKILELFTNRFDIADIMTKKLQLLNHSYCYYPWLIIQDGKDSTIGSNYNRDHKKVLKCLNDINYNIDNYYKFIN